VNTKKAVAISVAGTLALVGVVGSILYFNTPESGNNKNVESKISSNVEQNSTEDRFSQQIKLPSNGTHGNIIMNINTGADGRTIVLPSLDALNGDAQRYQVYDALEALNGVSDNSKFVNKLPTNITDDSGPIEEQILIPVKVLENGQPSWRNDQGSNFVAHEKYGVISVTPLAPMDKHRKIKFILKVEGATNTNSLSGVFKGIVPEYSDVSENGVYMFAIGSWKEKYTKYTNPKPVTVDGYNPLASTSSEVIDYTKKYISGNTNGNYVYLANPIQTGYAKGCKKTYQLANVNTFFHQKIDGKCEKAYKIKVGATYTAADGSSFVGK
jgi:hypothetical protein